MDPPYGNPSHLAWASPDTLAFHGLNFPAPPSRSLEPSQRGSYTIASVLADAHSSELQAEAAVRQLAALDLNQRQIRALRKPKHRAAIAYLAAIDEDAVDVACTKIFSERPWGRQSNQIPARYPSGVPSLISDQSSFRASLATNFSLPGSDSSIHEPEHISNLSHGPSQWKSIPDDAHVA